MENRCPFCLPLYTNWVRVFRLETSSSKSWCSVCDSECSSLTRDEKSRHGWHLQSCKLDPWFECFCFRRVWATPVLYFSVFNETGNNTASWGVSALPPLTRGAKWLFVVGVVLGVTEFIFELDPWDASSMTPVWQPKYLQAVPNVPWGPQLSHFRMAA